MALAVCAAIAAGIAGFVPLWAALRASRRVAKTGMAATAVQSLLGVFISLIVLGGALFACSRMARALVPVFGGVEIVTFIGASVAYFLRRNKVFARSASDTSKGDTP